MNTTMHIDIGRYVIVGLISVIVWGGFTMELALCTNASKIFSMEYPETQNVCQGDSVYAGITLTLSKDVAPTAIRISVLDQQFAEWANVRGEFHNEDDLINRWTIRITLQGNTMVYEISNSKIELKDEFFCCLEMESARGNSKSDLFRLFHVEKCTSQTRPASSTTETPSLVHIMEQLKQMGAVLNATESATVELRKQNANQHDMMRKVENITEESIQKATESSDQLRGLINGLLNGTESSTVELHKFLNMVKNVAYSAAESTLRAAESSNKTERMINRFLNVTETAIMAELSKQNADLNKVHTSSTFIAVLFSIFLIIQTCRYLHNRKVFSLIWRIR